MAVPEALSYLPQEREAFHAFDVVNEKYPAVTLEELKALSQPRIQQIVADYITTSVAYFANYSVDSYLEKVGTTAWHAINQRRAITAYCEDPRVGAMQVGIPLQHVRTLKLDEPNIIVMGSRQGAVVGETAIAIIPPHLIIRAQQTPVEALATMVFIWSQVMDYSNGRTYIDREWMIPRAGAIEAQFLLQALKEQPELQLGPFFRETLIRYPNGVADLPPNARYKGTSGIEAKKADQN